MSHTSAPNHSILAATCVLAVLTTSVFAATEAGAPRIAVVGASVTAGFRLDDHAENFKKLRETAESALGRRLSDAEYAARTDSVSPGEVLGAVYGRDVTTYADTYLFMDPDSRARKVLTSALEDRAELVIGLDLMFWFGYGTARDKSSEAVIAEQRVAHQQRGFELFDELSTKYPGTTFVLGDYPNMAGALPLMVTADMIPTPEVLATLNARMAAWAESRPRIQVFPISATLQSLRAGAATLTIDGEQRTLEPGVAFQLAAVHPTRLGVALLVRDLSVWLATHVEPRLRPRRIDDEVFPAAAGADWELAG